MAMGNCIETGRLARPDTNSSSQHLLGVIWWFGRLYVLAADHLERSYHRHVCDDVCAAAIMGRSNAHRRRAGCSHRCGGWAVSEYSLARDNEVRHDGVSAIEAGPFTWDVENHHAQRGVAFGHINDGFLIGFN